MITVNGFKICSSCRETKPATGKYFFKHRSTQDGLQNACNMCKAQMNRNWKHALKTGEFDQMLEEQQGLCQICFEPVVDPCLDHDHETGKMRSILCRKHNALLGMANDDLKILRNAVSYLERWTEE
jgi:hypothetical protein